MYLPLPFISYYILSFEIELRFCPFLYKMLILYFKIETKIKLIMELIFLIVLGLN
jgi:hypothetical protein